ETYQCYTRTSSTHPSVGSLFWASVSCANWKSLEAFRMPLHSHRAHSSSFSCSICNEFVELETAKSDEFGQPVHEECYAQQISLKRSIRPPPEAADAKRNYVSESIRTFLTIVEGRAIPNFCSVCGSRLEHRKL